MLESLGLYQAAARLAQADAALLAFSRQCVDEARAQLDQFGARGVPTFILETGDRRRLLPASAAFSDPQAFVQMIVAA